MDDQQLMTEVGAYEAIQSDHLANTVGGGGCSIVVDADVEVGDDNNDDDNNHHHNDDVLNDLHIKIEPCNSNYGIDSSPQHVKCTQCNRVGFALLIYRTGCHIHIYLLCTIALSQPRGNESASYYLSFKGLGTFPVPKMQPKFCIARWTLETL